MSESMYEATVRWVWKADRARTERGLVDVLEKRGLLKSILNCEGGNT